MKFSFVLFFLATFFLTACQPAAFYQLLQIKPIGNSTDTDGIVFQDVNIKVIYNLWSSGGDIGFTIFNKSDGYITLDLTQCYFVMNGYVYDYHEDRTIDKSYSEAANRSAYATVPYYSSTRTIGLSSSSAAGVSSTVAEKAQRTLPPKTALKITRFSITGILYSDCNLARFPGRGRMSVLSFERADTPYAFYNILNYTSDGQKYVEVKHEFYLEKVTNYPRDEFVYYPKENECGKLLYNPSAVFKFDNPTNFYIPYTR